MRPHLRNSLILCVLTLSVYAQTFSFGFVTIDDPSWIVNNAFVNSGVNATNVRWAFSFNTVDALSNWMPLTFLSLMVDAQLFGMGGGGFHLTNVLLHCASVLFLYAALVQLTGATTKSAIVAALFAVHPLHVESVAWVTERKDVLSLCFGHAAIWAYALYVTGARMKYYLASVALFLCSLLSKQTLVTLPFLLLLLDYWPLYRTSALANPLAAAADEGPARSVPWRRLIIEKIPFLILTVLFCGLALFSQANPRGQFCVPVPVAGVWAGTLVASAQTVCFHGLVLVSGNAGSGHRPGPDRYAAHGRPVYLSASDRDFSARRLAGGRSGAGKYAAEAGAAVDHGALDPAADTHCISADGTLGR